MNPEDFTAALSSMPAAPISPPAPPDAPQLVMDPTTGAMLSIPALQAATPKPTLDDAIAAAQRQALLQGANTNTGAPAEVRLAVGSSSDPATRLARLKEFYPDAQPLSGTGNFVYTDPASGKPMTYSPMGLRIPTMGDLASLAPEAAEGAGAVLGGIGGSIIGGPGVGTAVGAGTGAIAAKEALQRGIAKFLGMPDLRTPQQQIADAGVTGLTNAVLPGLTDAAGRTIATSLLQPSAGTATQQAAKALSDAGVTPGLLDVLPTGVASESTGLQRVESGLMQTPTGGTVANRYAQTGASLRGGVQNIANTVAAPQGVPAPDTFANTVQGIANDIIANKTAQGTALKDAVNTQLGSQPVTFDNLRSVMTRLRAQQSVSPQSMAQVFDPAVTYGNNILADADARGGSLPFANVLQQRTLANNIPDWLTNGGAAALKDSPMKQVAGAVRQDLYDTAWAQTPQGGGPAYRALNDYDSFWRNWLNGPNDTMNALASDKTKAQTIQQLMTGSSPKAQTDMATLWSNATPEQRGVLQGGVLNTMGDTPQGFDMGKFNTNWRSLNQPQKDLVFGSGPGSLAESLDNLATVQNSIRDAGMTRGHSNTAAAYAVMTMLGTAAGHLLAGEPGAAAGAVVSPLAAPYATARLLQSRPFVNAVTGTWGVNPATAGWWGNAVGRVAAAGEADPGISDLVKQYVSALPPEPQTTPDGRVRPGTTAQ